MTITFTHWLLPLCLGAVLSAQQTGDPAPQDKPAAKPAPQPAAAHFEVGKPVDAALELKDLDGNTKTLKDYQGKVLAIAFWSIKCPALVAAEPKLIKMTKAWAGKDVVVLGINANQDELGTAPEKPGKDVGYEKIREHISDKGVPFGIALDHGNTISARFQAKTTPHCFVIDQKGVLRYSGALDDDQRDVKGKDAKNYVQAAVDALLAGQEVKESTTKPYG